MIQEGTKSEQVRGPLGTLPREKLLRAAVTAGWLSVGWMTVEAGVSIIAAL